jgi:hypothetical protein
VDEALAILPPSVWYISIPFIDEGIRRRIEPGAPPIADRFALISQLVSAGHVVNVGINPLVPEWLPQPHQLISQLVSLNVWGVWVERLHLNRQQVGRMTTREIEAMGGDVLRRAQQYKTSQADLNHFHLVRQMAAAAGLQVYSHGQPNPSQFWAPFQRIYPRVFPLVQDVINQLHAKGQNLLSFAEFANRLTPKLPAGNLPLVYYFGATSRDIWRRRKVPRLMTYEQLLGMVWDDPKTKFSLLKGAGFALLRDAGQMVTDEGGRPFLAWRPEGFNGYWLDV